MWTGNLRTLFCLTKGWQIQIIYRFTWKYIICLRCVCLKVADCFLSSLFLNICLSSLLNSVKRRHILCTGEHGKWNIKCIIFYSHEYCGKGEGSRNSSCMPRWRFNVFIVQLHKYIYYWSLEIFKSTFCFYIFFWFWDISPYWSLAYWSLEIGR